MAPGGSVAEVLAVRNDSGAPFTLSLRASGTTGPLWNDLELGVWEAGTAAPVPFPALLLWTTQDNALGVLQAGQTVSYEVELYLPPTHHAGGEQVVQHIHVRSDPRHQPAHGVAVKEAHLQALEVRKKLLAQVVHHALPHHLHGERLRKL